MLRAAVEAGVLPEVVLIAEGQPPPEADVEMVVVTDAVLDAIAPTESPRGPIAVIAIPEPAPLTGADTVVLWEVSTPGNVGTLFRSAAAFGWNVATHGGADPWSPKVLRAGAGAHFDMAISDVESVTELRRAGLYPVATVPTGGIPPDDLVVDGPIALLVGNEASGLPPELVDAAEASVTIPMQGPESLNAAVAGSITMYALRYHSSQ